MTEHTGDHVFTDWMHFPGDPANAVEEHWERFCTISSCSWRQYTNIDPASTDPVDRGLARLAGQGPIEVHPQPDKTRRELGPLRIGLEELLDELPADDYLRAAVETQVALFKAREHPEAGHDRIDYLVAMKALTRIVSRELGRRHPPQ